MKLPFLFLSKEIVTTIQGDEGLIEVAYQSTPESQGGCLVCHPHPLYGGNMTNKVVTTVIKAATKMQYLTYRFNYRGVGRSEGQYDHGIGEVADTYTVAKWANQTAGKMPNVLVGFSFGAYIAYQAADALGVDKLVMIAPAVDQSDYEKIKPVKTPLWVIVPEQDEVTAAKKQKSFNPEFPCSLDNIGLNFYIFKQKICWKSRICHNTSNLCSCQNYHSGFFILEPLFY